MGAIPFGTWTSPLTADAVAEASLRFREIHWDGSDLYWLEGRPSQQGRQVPVRWRDGSAEDALPGEINVRSRVHEYGGGALSAHGGVLYYSDDRDGRVYAARGRETRALTPEGPYRYGDLTADPTHRRILAVREDHGSGEVKNEIVAIPWEGGPVRPLVSGADFYSFPRPSPDGGRLAWTCWNHPNMPWDGSTLWVAEVGPDGAPASPREIAGGDDVSVFQPQWSPEGRLAFVSDRTGWWNLYLWDGETVRPLHLAQAEFAEPQWILGQSTFAFLGPDRLLAVATEGARSRLVEITLAGGAARDLPSPFTEFHALKSNGAGLVAFVGASPTRAPEVVCLDVRAHDFRTLRRSHALALEAVSVAEPFRFPGNRGRVTHGFLYRPKSAAHRGLAGEKPPCLVVMHGGPTGSTSTSLEVSVQYWTSRGFAVADINYGGSTGYGREYRNRLRGEWGIGDVEDCVAAARYLVEHGDVDGERLFIRGGSAGGYTALCALTFHRLFRAGASYYGVSDLQSLLTDTHKFESRYLDSLLGDLDEDALRRRSPLFHGDRIQAPVIFFQGLEDKVVPPNQTERLYRSLKDRGIPVAYVPFPGEGHGFRRRENLCRALEAELYFYRRVLGLPVPAGEAPVKIENFD